MLLQLEQLREAEWSCLLAVSCFKAYSVPTLALPSSLPSFNLAPVWKSPLHSTSGVAKQHRHRGCQSTGVARATQTQDRPLVDPQPYL